MMRYSDKGKIMNEQLALDLIESLVKTVMSEGYGNSQHFKALEVLKGVQDEP